MRNARLFAGSSHPELAELVAERLGVAPTAPLRVHYHANRELHVELGVTVRKQDVFIVQSGSDCTNDHLLELLAAISSCRSCDAWRITVVMPYMPYSRQTKMKKMARGAICAKLVANMLALAGADHVITLDLHNDQLPSFFNRPVDNLVAEPTLCHYVTELFDDCSSAVIVSRHPGGVKRATSFADRLKADFALIHRDSSLAPKTTEVHDASLRASPLSALQSQSRASMTLAKERIPSFSSTDIAGTTVCDSSDSLALIESIPAEWREDGLHLVGSVNRRPCFIVDDIVDLADGFIAAANLLVRKGATRVVIVATHALLSGNSLEEMEACPHIHSIIVTNSYPISPQKRINSKKLRVIDISVVLAEAIRRTHNAESISTLYSTSTSQQSPGRSQPYA